MRIFGLAPILKLHHSVVAKMCANTEQLRSGMVILLTMLEPTHKGCVASGENYLPDTTRRDQGGVALWNGGSGYPQTTLWDQLLEPGPALRVVTEHSGAIPVNKLPYSNPLFTSAVAEGSRGRFFPCLLREEAAHE